MSGRDARGILPRMRIALFDDGFRPFFLAASGLAAFHVLGWIAFLTGNGTSPPGWSPFVWHGHEMVFGFASALIAGFLLTAVGNWTGRRVAPPWLIAALLVLWVIPRVGLVFPILPMAVTQVLAAAFFPALAIVIARPIIATKNVRNYQIIAILVALSIAGIAVHLWPSVTYLRTAIDVVMILMTIIGGRVIPFFTSRTLPALGVVDRRALGHTAAGAVIATAVAGWLFPGADWVSWLAVVAGVLLLARMWFWKPWGTLRQPMLWILHLGYLWIAVSLILRATPLPPASSLHALTMGALGCLAIGMMSRVALGHSGRMIRADAWIVLSFVLVAVAVIPRLVYPELPFNHGRIALFCAAMLWAGGFTVYFLRYLPVMVTPRPRP